MTPSRPPGTTTVVPKVTGCSCPEASTAPARTKSSPRWIILSMSHRFHRIDSDPGPRTNVRDQRRYGQHRGGDGNQNRPFHRAHPIELGAKEHSCAHTEYDPDGNSGAGNH